MKTKDEILQQIAEENSEKTIANFLVNSHTNVVE